MKKRINGFFLAETIVMVALVTTVVVFLYPNVSKLYENYNNRVNSYDRVQDIYLLKFFKENLNIDNDFHEQKKKVVKDAAEALTDTNKMESIRDVLPAEFETVVADYYIAKYMDTPTSSDYEFNKYLSRLKKTTYSPNAYRLIGVFKRGKKTTYASIKIMLED